MAIRNIFTNPSETEELSKKELLKGIQSQFPVETGEYRLEASDIVVDDSPLTKAEEKDALLKTKSVIRHVRGTLTLKDKRTGKVLDVEKNFPLSDFYKMTDKHTLIYKGNNYSIANLIQLMPGVYTRSKKDGELEAQINTGTGRGLSMQLNPESGMFTMTAQGSKAKIPVAPLLTEVFGVSDREVSKYVPSDVWAKSSAGLTPVKVSGAIDTLYSSVVDRSLQKPGASYDDKRAAVRHSLEKSQLSPLTTKITLGVEKEAIDKEVLLQAMKNIVDVHRGTREEDNRDSLEFKRVQSLPDFVRDRFVKEDESVKKVKKHLTYRLSRVDQEEPKIKGVIAAKPFKDVFSNIIVRSNLSSTPTETNPLESLENVGKVTAIAAGEGGMSSSRMADFNTKNIHPSHLGIIDPSRTPESGNAGLDQRFTISAMRDDKGVLYSKLINAKTGKEEAVSAQKLMSSSVGFPHQKGTKVYAQVKGKILEVDRSKVDYWVPDSTHMYTVTTNMVPFMGNNHPGRLTMAGKALSQALSLENREVPLVQTMAPSGRSFSKDFGEFISTRAPVSGTIERVASDQIVIRDSEGKLHKVELIKNMPFNAKGFHDDIPIVKAGDTVKKGQVIADNTYTKDGHLALGKNLVTAYMPYKGYNHEDGLVISRTAAKSMSSNHAYKYAYSMKRTTEANLNLFRRYFERDFKHDQYSKLDSKGFVKKGTKLQYGDPVYLLLEPNQPTAEDKALGRLHKTLVSPYRRVMEIWDHDEPGEVIESHTDGKEVMILVRSVKSLEIGDKMTGLHGNKGVVSLIMDDDQMPRIRGTDKPVDVLLNPASVTSRVNLGQVLEVAAGKVAEKRGTPMIIQNFEHDNTLKFVQGELKKEGLTDTELLYDPVSGKDYGNVLTGPQYVLKLSKTTDQNYAARNVGKYDQYLQPMKGGTEGAKSIGLMEFLGLLGSDARHNLREIGTTKSEKNEEYWTKFMTGQPLPKPKMTFATKRLFDQMRGAGIQVKVDNDVIQAAPMTDEDIVGRSHGLIKKPVLVDSKNVLPEKGGLFDVNVTGGLTGDKWSHFSLTEPVVNPAFEKPVMKILGLSKADFDRMNSGEYKVIKKSPTMYSVVDRATGRLVKVIDTGTIMEKTAEEWMEKAAARKKVEDDTDYSSMEGMVGGTAFKDILSSINIDKALEKDKEAFKSTTSVAKKDAIVKRMKYIHGLKENGFKNPAQAYIMHNVPIIPPVMRPVVDQGGNRLEFADINMLYQEAMQANETLGKVKDDLTDDLLIEQRKNHYDSVKAITGLGESINFKSRKAGVSGLLTGVAGNESPKYGMFLNRIMKKKQDFSGRGTIYADPTLGFNEAAMPKEQLWVMYKMHILRKLGQQGYSLTEAKKAYDDRSLPATTQFNQLLKEVPVILNRAPTLMRTNIMAVRPVPVEGNTIGMNILHLPGYAADFDGDALSMFLPMSPEAVREANEKLLPMRHLHDARKGFGVPMFAPGHEAILGSVHITEPDSGQDVVKFKTEKDALQALQEGKIKDNTPIQITG